MLKTFADRLCIYHGEDLIATHTRSYDRHRDFENPDHSKELLERRHAARDAKLLLSFTLFVRLPKNITDSSRIAA
jgi:hypothetical protein